MRAYLFVLFDPATGMVSGYRINSMPRATKALHLVDALIETTHSDVGYQHAKLKLLKWVQEHHQHIFRHPSLAKDVESFKLLPAEGSE